MFMLFVFEVETWVVFAWHDTTISVTAIVR